MTDPRRPRDELADHIAEGDPDVMLLIANVLVNEVLPTLDRLSEEIAGMHYRLSYAAMAISQIGAIYAHLQDLAPLKRQALLAQERRHWQERMERAADQLEAKAKQ
jgi:hypothetical protein